MSPARLRSFCGFPTLHGSIRNATTGTPTNVNSVELWSLFMHTKNKSEPRTLPCETPEITEPCVGDEVFVMKYRNKLRNNTLIYKLQVSLLSGVYLCTTWVRITVQRSGAIIANGELLR